jgi:hypothetical protein
MRSQKWCLPENMMLRKMHDERRGLRKLEETFEALRRAFYQRDVCEEARVLHDHAMPPLADLREFDPRIVIGPALLIVLQVVKEDEPENIVRNMIHEPRRSYLQES